MMISSFLNFVKQKSIEVIHSWTEFMICMRRCIQVIDEYVGVYREVFVEGDV